MPSVPETLNEIAAADVGGPEDAADVPEPRVQPVMDVVTLDLAETVVSFSVDVPLILEVLVEHKVRDPWSARPRDRATRTCETPQASCCR